MLADFLPGRVNRSVVLYYVGESEASWESYWQSTDWPRLLPALLKKLWFCQLYYRTSRQAELMKDQLERLREETAKIVFASGPPVCFRKTMAEQREISFSERREFSNDVMG